MDALYLGLFLGLVLLGWGKIQDVRFSLRNNFYFLAFVRALKVASLFYMAWCLLPVLVTRPVNLVGLLAGTFCLVVSYLAAEYMTAYRRVREKGFIPNTRPSKVERVTSYVVLVTAIILIASFLVPTKLFFHYNSLTSFVAVKAKPLEMLSDSWAILPGRVSTLDTVFCGLTDERERLVRVPVEMISNFAKREGRTISAWTLEDTLSKIPFRPYPLHNYCQTRSYVTYFLLGFIPKPLFVESDIFPVD